MQNMSRRNPNLQRGGYFPLLPTELNEYIQGYLGARDASTARAMSRLASTYHPTRENWLNAPLKDLVRYANRHPDDETVLEILFWKTLRESPYNWEVSGGSTEVMAKYQSFMRRNLDTVLNHFYTTRSLGWNVGAALKKIGVDFQQYWMNRMRNDCTTMTFDQLWNHPLGYTLSNFNEEILVSRFGEQRLDELHRHWDDRDYPDDSYDDSYPDSYHNIEDTDTDTDTDTIDDT